MCFLKWHFQILRLMQMRVKKTWLYLRVNFDNCTFLWAYPDRRTNFWWVFCSTDEESLFRLVLFIYAFNGKAQNHKKCFMIFQYNAIANLAVHLVPIWNSSSYRPNNIPITYFYRRFSIWTFLISLFLDQKHCLWKVQGDLCPFGQTWSDCQYSGVTIFPRTRHQLKS